MTSPAKAVIRTKPMKQVSVQANVRTLRLSLGMIDLTIIPGSPPARKDDGAQSDQDKDGRQYDHDCRDDMSRSCETWWIDQVGINPRRWFTCGGLGQVGARRNLVHGVWQRRMAQPASQT